MTASVQARGARARAARSSMPKAAPASVSAAPIPTRYICSALVTKTNGTLKRTAIATPASRQVRAPAEIHRHATKSDDDRQERRAPARDRLPRTIGGDEPEDPGQPMREIDPGGVVRRPTVAAELSERRRSPGEEPDDEQRPPCRQRPTAPAGALGSDTRRMIAWTARIAGSSITPSSLTMNDAVAKTRSGSHQTSARARTACHHRKAHEHDERLRQVHLIRDPGHERVRHRRMGDDQQRRGGGRDHAVGQVDTRTSPSRLAAIAKSVSETA